MDLYWVHQHLQLDRLSMHSWRWLRDQQREPLVDVRHIYLLGYYHSLHRWLWRLQRLHQPRVPLPDDRRIPRNRHILLLYGLYKFTHGVGNQTSRNYRRPKRRCWDVAPKAWKMPKLKFQQANLRLHQKLYRELLFLGHLSALDFRILLSTKTKDSH